MGGGRNVPENAPSRKILDPSTRASGLLSRGFLYRKNRATTPEGGGKPTVQGGSKTLFGRGVIREVFLPPLFPTPPMASPEGRLCRVEKPVLSKRLGDAPWTPNTGTRVQNNGPVVPKTGMRAKKANGPTVPEPERGYKESRTDGTKNQNKPDLPFLDVLLFLGLF